MNTEYETPVIDILLLSDDDVIGSQDHDNGYGDFEDWE